MDLSSDGMIMFIYIYIYIMAEASFSAYFWGFLQGKKQHILAIVRQEREKGRNKKEDQNWSCFSRSKSALFSPILSKCLTET